MSALLFGICVMHLLLACLLVSCFSCSLVDRLCDTLVPIVMYLLRAYVRFVVSLFASRLAVWYHTASKPCYGESLKCDNVVSCCS